MNRHLSEKDLQKQTNYRRNRHSRLVEQNKELERLAKKRGRMSFLLLAVVLVFAASPMPDWLRSHFGQSASPDTAAVSEEHPSDTAAFENSPDSHSAGADIYHTGEIAPAQNTASGGAGSTDYNVMLDTAMGPMFYYNQHDPLWADYLWNGTDPLTHYGCGPTALAMIANAFGNSGTQLTPVELADWAAANGYFSEGHGSVHGVVPAALTAYGLQVTSMQDQINADAVRNELQTGHVLVCLVKTGYFTASGHFIIITNLNEDGTVSIADPNSLENTMTSFDLDFVLGELMTDATDDGSPLWSVGR